MNEQQVVWIWKPLLRKGKDKKNQHKYFFHMYYKFWSLIHDISYSDIIESIFYRTAWWINYLELLWGHKVPVSNLYTK